ncbi:hypothetical protein ACLKA6_006911 [Drosophila palustris]
MNNDIDLELAQTVNRLDVLSSQPGYGKLTDSQDICTPIEKNPFFVSYNPTDLRLWQKGGEGIVKKLANQRKTLIRKPILQHLKHKTKSMGKEWLKSSVNEMQHEASWLRVICPKKATLKPTCSLNDLITECDRLIETEIIFRDNSNSKEISELSSYFDSITRMPQKMSDMAESMYS